MTQVLSTAELVGKRVIGGKDGTQRIGKVRCCIFHPRENRCVGFLVKRPDVALMFHRPDLFVSLDGFCIDESGISLVGEDDSSGRAAARRLGIDPEGCIVWSGLPVLTTAKEKLGYVGAVLFDATTGVVQGILVSSGAANSALMGTMRIPGTMICGFQTGIGEPLLAYGEIEDEGDIDPRTLGALVVTREAAEIALHGGAVEHAGHATAVALDKVKGAASDAKPVVESAARKAGEAVSKGAYATGRQIGRTKGMFSAFKEEYEKARHADE